MADPADLAEQALQAKEQGVVEILRLLQRPEDLARLADITAEYESRQKSAKATLSAMVQTQVESTSSGMDLLEKARRHIAKLQAALDKIDRLCAECADLVQHHDKIKLLALTHGNMKRVLSEIDDIIDLPYRAERCWELLMEDDANLVPAFEALTLLTGTAENAKQARRNTKVAAQAGQILDYLTKVDEVMVAFEELLFDQHLKLPGMVELAQERPTILVDCVRVIELQELLDAEYRRVKMGAVPQRRYRDRLFSGLVRDAEARFGELLEMAQQCHVPNDTVKYDQNENPIINETRDYSGALTRVTRLVGGQEETVTDPDQLQGIEVTEEEIFDEDKYLDELLNGLYDMTDELAAVYDYAAPCFPAEYDIFNRIFQCYHVQFAIVVDVLGHAAADGMSTKGALRCMDWVQKYMDTLRNLGVDEALIRLPPSPLADPDSLPGMVVLMDSYVHRMETTVTDWYMKNLKADLDAKYVPQVTADGTLATLGAVEFFRILNQQIAIIEKLNDHGEVMFQTAKTALRVMSSYQAAQRQVLVGPSDKGAGGERGSNGNKAGGPGAGGRPMSLELAVAFLNNNVRCHDQSLEFAEDVQRQLDQSYRSQLDIEDVCRGFLEVAKAGLDIEDVCRGFLEVAKLATYKAVSIVFNDPGMSNQLKVLYSSGAEYTGGRATNVLIATLKDYFSDFKKWVLPSFLKRVAEAALEELVRRAANMFVAVPPTPSEPLLKRMAEDEADLAAYFETYLRPDRLRRPMALLSDMRELLVADTPEEFSLAFANLIAAHPGFTLDLATRILASRTELQKKQVADITAQCRELWKAREASDKAARGEADAAAGGGWFGWGKKGA
ncbi:hypothetical protein HYH03_008836 [Edaphochlamys debaryana]|uniref:Exocyst complex component Sec6 n=1 Tax=Edaphochlamys debaryana TaxID=47281 RepID=A0A836BXN0_9CHLO|nr:hypothetical protein HYH03_008836 [Edaphochlamys debaryana]|eukprot:KAG2492926.1 hypothetical protein HYH03_008836 [Edaphochlamys debaryana]